MDSIIIYRRQKINHEEPKKSHEVNIKVPKETNPVILGDLTGSDAIKDKDQNEAKVVILEILTNYNKIKTPTLIDNDIPMLEYIQSLLIKNNLEDLTPEDVINM